MKIIFMLFVVFSFSKITSADYTVNYGWESTDTILGMRPADCVIAQIATDPVHGGSQSLYLERVSDDTPQAYIAWIVGLQDGDEITVSVWFYDDTPGSAPRGRTWAHWNDSPGDVNVYSGSASGPGFFTTGIGWEEIEWTWTVVDSHTGLVIEARIYSNPGDAVWIDDMTVTVPDHATIYTPGTVALENSTWGDIKAAF